jgi:hypothetical protein
MTNWGVYPHGMMLISGSEVDFIESPQVAAYPGTGPAANDTLAIQWPDKSDEIGNVTEATGDQITISTKRGIFVLRKATPKDVLNPIKSSVRVDRWIVG